MKNITPHYKLQIATLLFMLLFISSCKNQEKYIGIYKSVVPNNVLKKKFKTQVYTINNELKLKKDSTFFFKTCGVYVNGKWSIKNGDIILESENARYRNDSINKIRKPEGKRFEELLILKKYKNIFVSRLNKGKLYSYIKKVE